MSFLALHYQILDRYEYPLHRNFISVPSEGRKIKNIFYYNHIYDKNGSIYKNKKKVPTLP